MQGILAVVDEAIRETGRLSRGERTGGELPSVSSSSDIVITEGYADDVDAPTGSQGGNDEDVDAPTGSQSGNDEDVDAPTGSQGGNEEDVESGIEDGVVEKAVGVDDDIDGDVIGDGVGDDDVIEHDVRPSLVVLTAVWMRSAKSTSGINEEKMRRTRRASPVVMYGLPQKWLNVNCVPTSRWNTASCL